MSIAMFIVGGAIFATYVAFLIWNIFYGSRKQREENYPDIEYYNRHHNLDADYDGIGNQGRFINKKKK
tara:strand:- start:247 stop:450 length:204 start_codon:yes stop_codon:yes gene_type:complete